MYLEFYGLKKEPFHITPDPEFLYLSQSHKEALAAMIYGVQQRKGFIAVTGEVGLGKTTILHSFLEQINHDHIRTVFVFNANVSYGDLLKFIGRELGVEFSSDQTFEMVHSLHMALIEEYKQGNNVVLLIDEAQNMPVETLENLRMLSNLETSKDKLLQIVLVGQPELESILNLNELRQLRQRIAVHAILAPLSQKESYDYIEHRLLTSGGRSAGIFDRGALRRIVRHSAGIPRKINILCDNALINGYGYMKKPVSDKIIKEMIADLEGKQVGRQWKWVFISITVLVFIAGLLLLSPYGKWILSNVAGLGMLKTRMSASQQSQGTLLQKKAAAPMPSQFDSGIQNTLKIRKKVPETVDREEKSKTSESPGVE
ncbi:ExeA family protein [Desulforhabdus amnigena]|uniref:AAA+ ATPase domain-containing protein n=1 Tax=Desulforhabdus amnigena TaxID=40218 RepID=A0A9W6FWW9_9BACT|nr:AAA family ATPase [Desulforhabdus amnigena]NLJ28566.1 AAA family ATPase [Deltaproteobacteria bacterium]GLI36317.1 hypothetical protein DAMNIGENAA_37500 [Desulforhabdus amnigena]